MSDTNAHYPPCGYAKIAKWFFTLLTSQAGMLVLFFPDQIPGIFHWVKIFAFCNVTKLHISQCIASDVIIVTLEMKRITICLQWGLIFIQKLNDWNINYIVCACNKLMTSDPSPPLPLNKTQRIWKSGQNCIGGDRLQSILFLVSIAGTNRHEHERRK